MIVRNEAAVIKRCLDSVKGIISHWIICDTGSTDDTRKVVLEELNGIPGTLYDDPWVDYGHNRSLAIARARGKADYHLHLDADETLHFDRDFRDELDQEAYLVRFNGSCDYQRLALVSDRHEWRYLGMAHEYVHADTCRTRARLEGVTLTHHFDGGSRADKYKREIELLTKGLEAEPDNSRYVFYLAQSYRDMGLMYQALEFYQKRATMGGWDEEVWYSMYQLARLQHLSMMAWPLVLNSYLAAYQFRPSRLEPIHCIARFYREFKQYHLGYLFSQLCLETSYPDDLLFIEKNIYEYELPLEYGICCYWLGRHEEAIRINDEIIACPNVPANFLETAAKNRQYSVDFLSKPPASANCGGAISPRI
jgi:glycosyltransferase involved in cell wall biosynthesis